MLAWTLTCRACRTELSRPLTELAIDVPPIHVLDGRDALPSGCLWRARPGFALLQPIWPDDILCCRRDLPAAVPGEGSIGCCGPSGQDGPNLRCVCGVAFATEFGDCWQPHLVCVHPKHVICVPATPEVGVHVYPSQSSRPSAWAFAAWLHALLGAEDWYGLELDALVREWAGRTPTPLVIVWLDSDREQAAGVPVRELIGRLAGGPITVVALGMG